MRELLVNTFLTLDGVMQGPRRDDSDALDGFEFLTMAEAGEVGHWKMLRTMAQAANDQSVLQLAEWALPIQERHFNQAQQVSLRPASEQDPNEKS